MYFLARGSFVVVLRLNVVSTELAIASGTEFRSTVELAELIGPYAFLCFSRMDSVQYYFPVSMLQDTKTPMVQKRRPSKLHHQNQSY